MNTRWSLLASLWCLVLAQNVPQTSNDQNWFIPDVVTPKHDPYDLISSDFGQPAGQYNWNSDQFKLMQRTQKTCDGCTEGGKHVVIQNLTIFVNDQEYFITAMCYTPVPLGYKSIQKDGSGGGGFCSDRRTAWGAVTTACLRGSDTDYFDGSSSPGRVPDAPANGWFTSLWERDFPIIKASGANTLRMYYMSPITRKYTEDVLAGTVTDIDGNIVAPAYGADHIPFLNLAHQHGLMVIFPLLGDQTVVYTMPAEGVQRYIMNLIDEVGNHPAILMYAVGNEWNIGDPVLVTLVNTYMDFARNYSMIKWGRKMLVTHCLMDDPHQYDGLYQTLHVDVFSTNAGYRGMGFSDLWDGTQTMGFSGLGPLSIKYGKPNFVSEIGWMQINGEQTAEPQNAGWFNVKWRDLITKGAVGAGCVGGAFFEYMDELNTKADAMEQTQGIVNPTISSAVAIPMNFTAAPVPSLTVGYGNPTTAQNSTDGSNSQNSASNPQITEQIQHTVVHFNSSVTEETGDNNNNGSPALFLSWIAAVALLWQLLL